MRRLIEWLYGWWRKPADLWDPHTDPLGEVVLVPGHTDTGVQHDRS